MSASLVGSEMCIRDRLRPTRALQRPRPGLPMASSSRTTFRRTSTPRLRPGARAGEPRPRQVGPRPAGRSPCARQTLRQGA
eukprot:4388099-Alexandrium_andersonii.AAC.1